MAILISKTFSLQLELKTQSRISIPTHSDLDMLLSYSIAFIKNISF